MADRGSRRHFLLALGAGPLSFFVLVPIAAFGVLGDRVHTYDGATQVWFDFLCTLIVVFLVYVVCELAWRSPSTSTRGRRLVSALLVMLLTPPLAVGVMLCAVYVIFAVTGT